MAFQVLYSEKALCASLKDWLALSYGSSGGDYRAILRLDRGKQEITVIEIGHRSNVYKNI